MSVSFLTARVDFGAFALEARVEELDLSVEQGLSVFALLDAAVHGGPLVVEFRQALAVLVHLALLPSVEGEDFVEVFVELGLSSVGFAEGIVRVVDALVEHTEIDVELLGDFFAFGELEFDLFDFGRERGDGIVVLIEMRDQLLAFVHFLLHGVEQHVDGGESCLAVHARRALLERGVEGSKILPVSFEVRLLRGEPSHGGLFADEFGFSRRNFETEFLTLRRLGVEVGLGVVVFAFELGLGLARILRHLGVVGVMRAAAHRTGHALFEFSAQFFDFRDLGERVGAFELEEALAQHHFLAFHAPMIVFELFEFAGVAFDVRAEVVDLLVALHDVLPTSFGLLERGVFLFGLVEISVEFRSLESAYGFAMCEHRATECLFAVLEPIACACGVVESGLHFGAASRILGMFEVEELVFLHRVGEDQQALVDHLETLEGAAVNFELLSAQSERFELSFELEQFFVAFLEFVLPFGHFFRGHFEESRGVVGGLCESFDFALDGMSLRNVGLFVSELLFGSVFAFARRGELLFCAFEQLFLLIGAPGEFGFGVFESLAHLFECAELLESGAERLHGVVAFEFEFVGSQFEELPVGIVI